MGRASALSFSVASAATEEEECDHCQDECDWYADSGSDDLCQRRRVRGWWWMRYRCGAVGGCCDCDGSGQGNCGELRHSKRSTVYSD